MAEEVQRFCDAFDALGDVQRAELIGFCCLTMGAYPALPANGEIPEHGPEFTKELLLSRMNHLVDQLHVKAEFLIPSLFEFLIDHHDRTCDPLDVNRRIDFFLNNIDHIGSELGKPVDQRDQQLSDEVLQGLRERNQELLTGVNAQKKQAEELSDWLQDQLLRRFSREYFEDLAIRRMRR